MTDLTEFQKALLRDALGIGWRKGTGPKYPGQGYRSRAMSGAWRNRSHALDHGTTHDAHRQLEALGFLVRDKREDYGRIMIWRVTPAGSKMVGVTLPKKLADLLPPVEAFAMAAE